MQDRAPTKPNRYAVYDDAHNFLRYEYHERADEPTQVGDALNKANLLPDDVATALGLTGNPQVRDALRMLARRTNNSLARSLNIMLNLSLGTSNIDAWADLLNNSDMISTMQGATLSGGVLSVYSATLSHHMSGSISPFGSSTQPKIGQSFVAPGNGCIRDFEVIINKVGSPPDGVVAKLYDSNKTTLIATSNTIESTSIGGPAHFSFPANAPLTNGVSYFLSLERTGSANSSAYYELTRELSGTYANGHMFFMESGVWKQSTSDIYMSVIVGAASATVVWKPVTSTEPFIAAAISAEQELSSGGIAYALSDDGSSWVAIDELDVEHPVTFNGTSVYLRAVLTGDATVSGIAWGGLLNADQQKED